MIFNLKTTENLFKKIIFHAIIFYFRTANDQV